MNVQETSTAQRAPTAQDVLLSVQQVTGRFRGIVALDGVSFDVHRGQIAGLIGPNGAGKTTLFNCLSRLYDYSEGHIHFDGQLLDPMTRHKTAEIGIGRTFQNLALYKTMSVLDNIKVGAHCRAQQGFFAHALRLPGVAAEEAKMQIELDKQAALDGIAAAELARTKNKSEFDLDRETKAAEIRIHETTEKAGAVQPGLIEALISIGRLESNRILAENLKAQGGGLAGIFQKGGIEGLLEAVKGTPLEENIKTFFAKK